MADFEENWNNCRPSELVTVSAKRIIVIENGCWVVLQLCSTILDSFSGERLRCIGGVRPGARFVSENTFFGLQTV